MAIVKCKECGAEVSDQAKACPKCGAPPPKETSRLSIALAGIVGITVLSCIVKTDEAATERGEKAAAQARAAEAMTPEQKAAAARAAEDKRRSENKRSNGILLARAAAATLKTKMREPESFKVAEAILLDDGTVCMSYRARNGFGGMAVERAAVLPDGSGIATGTAQYNKLCADRAGQDVANAM